ncbi:MAG TPA: hypothetical protein VG167_20655 [Verrucomicrobiae bacterium]|nr:hypothetical protein [Verrucomicrobiae bacterium]
MAGIFEVKELQARKRALVAESEAYRHALNLEVHNVRLYMVGFRRKLRRLRALRPLLVLLPLAGWFVRSRSHTEEPKARPAGLRRLLGWGLLAWRMSRQYGPLVGTLLGKLRERRHYARATHNRWTEGEEN